MTPHHPTATSLPVDAAVAPDDVAVAREFIAEALAHLEAAEAEVLKLEDDPADAEAINAVFRGFHTIKGVAGFLNLRQIGALAHAAENLLDLARKSELGLRGPSVDVVLESVDRMKELVASLDRAIQAGAAPAADDLLPALLARLAAAAAQPPGPDAPSAIDAQRTAAPPNTDGPPSATGLARPGPQASARATVKVSTERLDGLINMVGEMVIAQSMVWRDVAALAAADPRFARNMSRLSKIGRALQDLSMSMRMVPIRGTFQKMARLLRDLSRNAGKDVELSAEGEQTELDRNLVEAIEDPLLHMVRNAVDHGIEAPGQRRLAGKPPAGRVTLKAWHEAGNILVRVSDDGRGLDAPRILEKAREAGLVPEGVEPAEQEVYQFIFHPGLSTAERLSSVSGRGVGMDVVRRNVEALRGRVGIESSRGSGTTFTLRLPLTLALLDGLLVRVGSQTYVLPTTGVELSIRPEARDLSTIQGRGRTSLVRGRLLPLFRLDDLLGAGSAPTGDPAARDVAIVVYDGQRRCCLVVDELLGQQQVVIKPLGEALGAPRGVAGGAILGDGNVSLILDVPGLLDLAAGPRSPAGAPPRKQEGATL